jgi:hypothetical protein
VQAAARGIVDSSLDNSKEAAPTQQPVPPRYLLWRTEDAVGLRSPDDQARLAAALSTFLELPKTNVMRGLENENPPVATPPHPKAAPVAAAAAAAAVSAASAAISAAKETGGVALPQPLQQISLQHTSFPQPIAQQPHQRRRLGYGKYLAELSLGEATLASSCAEAAAPGAMASFGYAPESVLLAFAQPAGAEQQDQKQLEVKPSQQAKPASPPQQQSIGQVIQLPKPSDVVGDINGDGGAEKILPAPRPVVSLDFVLLAVSLATLLTVEWRRRFAREEGVEVGNG